MGTHRPYRELKYDFGKQVLTFRTRVALTQLELAEESGVHRRSVQNWKTGESYPKADTLQRLIAVFLRHQAFTAGQERTEALGLWSQAAQDGPHALAPFDDDWFARTLASSTVSSAAAQPSRPQHAFDSASSPAPQPDIPRTLIDWGEAIAVPRLFGREPELETLHTWIVSQ